MTSPITNHLPALKVVELASVLAGPAVGQFFAELGAEVIKIENSRVGGDVTRVWRLPQEDSNAPMSAYYSSINWGKTVWMKDLKQEEHRKDVLNAIREADIVIANFRETTARKLGMHYDQIKEINPTVIYGEIKGYPHSERAAFDVVLQAETGFLSMCGEPGRVPVKMPVALIDILAAHQLKEGVLLALLKKERTGEGSYVSTSLYESALASLANQATNFLNVGHIPQAMGTQHPNIAPYGDLFLGKDGKYLVLAIGSDAHFKKLCEIIQMPSMATEERFATNTARVKHRDQLISRLESVIKEWDTELLNQTLEQYGVPAGIVRNLKEVLTHPDAQSMPLTYANGMKTLRTFVAKFNV